MRKFLSKKEAIIGSIALILFFVCYFFVVSTYTAEEKKTSESGFFSGDEARKDKISVEGKVLSIDPVKGELVVRLQFYPEGSYVSKDGVSLSKNIDILVNSITGKSLYTFKKGDIMSPADVVVELQESVSKYPFDKHKSNFYMEISTPLASGSVSSPPEDYDFVPFTINFGAALNGYNNTAIDNSEDDSSCDVDITVQRSSIVITFVCFVMVIKWALALSALFVTLSVVVRKRKVELAMFSWLAALLFALPPLRNAMPNVPPIGSLNDILSFFWAEGIVAISLVAMVFVWLIRTNGEKKPS
jgi:hypothetical protein